MKLTFVLLTMSFLHVHAVGMSQEVSFSGRNVQLEEVFASVKKQTGYNFFYDVATVREVPPLTLNISKKPLELFLTQLLANTRLAYTIENKNVIVGPNKDILKTALAPKLPLDTVPVIKILSGRITDSIGRGLAGVSVVNTRSKTGTVSDQSGNYSIEVRTNDQLDFSSVGYEPITILVSDNTSLANINMMLSYAYIEPVSISVTFNTGFQVLNKERATGSFSKPDMSVYKKRTGTMDILSRLEGQIAGLVQPANSSGGTVNIKRSIRGVSSLGLSSEPLYVVNGVIVSDFNSVNPDDIEDITVLKDAAAAAIYGTNSANGVIVITTKSGSKNQPLSVQYNGFLNIRGKPDWGYIPVLNSQQYIQAARETFFPALYPDYTLDYSSVGPHDQILYAQYNGVISEAQANKSLDSLAGINNRSQLLDLLYRPSFTNNHTVSVNGGNDIYSFYASLGYSGEQFATPGSNHSDAYKINLTQNLYLNEKIKFSLQASLINTTALTNTRDIGGPTALPYQLFRDAEGNSISTPYGSGYSDRIREDWESRSRISMNYNLLEEMKYSNYRKNDININVTGNASIKLWKGLSFEGTYGYVRTPSTATYFEDNRSLSQRLQIIGLTIAPDANSTPEYLIPIDGGTLTSIVGNQRNWTVRNQLAYQANTRRGRDRLSIQVGQEAQENFYENNTNLFYGYNKQLGTSAAVDLKRLSTGVPGTVTGYGFLLSGGAPFTQTLSRYTSLFALGSYGINGRYFLDISWRQDKSNLFGSEVTSQNKPVWSVGGKWNVSKERFFATTPKVNELLLRATVGFTGMSPYSGTASTYDILSIINAATVDGGAPAGNALRLSQAGNKTVSWERTRNINLGIDMSLFNNRISGSIDVYSRVTTDLLTEIPSNRFTGFVSTTGNAGKFSNKGIELSLRTVNISWNKFSWSTAIVFSYNKNLLKELPVFASRLQSGESKLNTSYFLGYPSNPLMGYDYAGLDNMGDPQIRLADKTITKDPFYQVKPEDIVYLGTVQPIYSGGFSNTVAYSGLSLTVNMIFSLGHKMFRDINDFYTGRLYAYGDPASGGNISPYFLDRWKKPGDELVTDIPGYEPDQSLNYSRRNLSYYTLGSSRAVSASYAKIRDMTLNYSFEASKIKAVKLQSLSIFVQATNFMVWKANKNDIDPEYMDLKGGYRTIPPFNHSYAVGINLTF